MQQATMVTLAIFVAGLIYHAGALSQRIFNLEARQAKLEAMIEREISELKDMLRAAIGERRNWREGL